MHGRDKKGLIPAALSVAHLPYEDAQDGISMTVSVVPSGLGKTEQERVDNLIGVLDGYVDSRGFHLNVNVLNREMLLDAMEQPAGLPAADDPRLRLRGELRPADPRAAAGRHRPHLPHERLGRGSTWPSERLAAWPRLRRRAAGAGRRRRLAHRLRALGRDDVRR